MRPGLSAVAGTVQQITDRFEGSPGDIRALIAQYPGDVPMWEEVAVLISEPPGAQVDSRAAHSSIVRFEG